jgi:hypothetical protein
VLRRSAMQAGANPWSLRASNALRICAGIYLAGIWLEAVGWTAPLRILPRSLAYFTQIAALFTRAASFSIDYRAEGYVCTTGEWAELDTRPYFPLDPDDKENRFQRVMYFFHRHHATLAAVDGYLVERHNEGSHDDSIPRDEKIGGVRLLSIRGPLPAIGAPLVRVHRRPLSEFPEDERKLFYQTKSSGITERCFGTHPKEEE